MKKHQSKKLKVVSLMVVVILTVFGAIWIKHILTRPVVLVEDINNRCSRVSDNKKLVTGVGSRYVYFEVPSYQVNKYLKDALSEGRCVSKKDNFHGQRNSVY